MFIMFFNLQSVLEYPYSVEWLLFELLSSEYTVNKSPLEFFGV